MYTITTFQNDLPLKDFISRYQNIEKYLAYCRECPNYNSVWSCPELAFPVADFLGKYSHICLVAVKIDLAKETIDSADTPEKIKQITKDILWKEKGILSKKLLTAEKHFPGSTSLTAGGCTLCAVCSRKNGQPCRQPGKMRYSLDSFGFDLSAITHDLLGYDIQWCHGRLPDYYTLVHALLTPQAVASAEIRQFL